MTTRHYLIAGRVQGVGYRAFALNKALARNIRGWARNLHDGRVEILGQGDPENLKEYEIELRRGPAHGNVTKLDSREAPPTDLATFEIRKDAVEPCFAL